MTQMKSLTRSNLALAELLYLQCFDWHVYLYANTTHVTCTTM